VGHCLIHDRGDLERPPRARFTNADGRKRRFTHKNKKSTPVTMELFLFDSLLWSVHLACPESRPDSLNRVRKQPRRPDGGDPAFYDTTLNQKACYGKNSKERLCKTPPLSLSCLVNTFPPNGSCRFQWRCNFSWRLQSMQHACLSRCVVLPPVSRRVCIPDETP
jgi:hypothetical protein